MSVEVFAANRAATTVSSGGTDAPAQGTQESWTVASPAMFPASSSGASPPTVFHVADPAAPSEIIAVTDTSGTAWTVTRGAESTAPVAHAAGFTVLQVVTTGAFGNFLQPQAGVKLPSYIAPSVTALTPGSAVTLDASLGNTFTLDMTGDTTLTLTSPQPGETVKLWVLGNSHTLNWMDGVLFGTAGEPSLSGDAWDLIGVEFSPSPLSSWCVTGFAPGFVVPDIAWSDGTSNQSDSGTTTTLTIPSDVPAGALVIIAAGGGGGGGATALSVSSAGTTQPVQLGTTLTGAFGSLSQLWYLTAADGDPGAVITITGTGGTPPLDICGALGAWTSAGVPQEGDWATFASESSSQTQDAPTLNTPVNACWCAEFLVTPVNAFLTITTPGDLTARTVNTNQAIVSDSAGVVGNSGTAIGGDTYSSSGDVVWHIWTLALRPA